MNLTCLAFSFYALISLSGIVGHSLSIRVLVRTGFPTAVFSGCFLMLSCVGVAVSALELVAASVHCIMPPDWFDKSKLKQTYVAIGWFLTTALLLCCLVLAIDRLLILRRRAHSPTWESRGCRLALSVMVVVLSGCSSVLPVLLTGQPDCADLQQFCGGQAAFWTVSTLVPECVQAVLALVALVVMHVALRGNPLGRFTASVLQFRHNQLRCARAIRWFILELCLGRAVLIVAMVILRLVYLDIGAVDVDDTATQDVTDDDKWSDVTARISAFMPLRYFLNLLSLTPVALAPYLLMGVSRRYRRLALSSNVEKPQDEDDKHPFFISSSLSGRGASVHPSTLMRNRPISVSCIINMEAPSGSRTGSSDRSNSLPNTASGSAATVNVPRVFRFSACEVQKYILETRAISEGQGSEMEEISGVNLDCPSSSSSRASNDVSISTVVTSTVVGKHRVVRVSSSASFRMDPRTSEDESPAEEALAEDGGGAEEQKGKEEGEDKVFEAEEACMDVAAVKQESGKKAPPASPRPPRKHNSPKKDGGVARIVSETGVSLSKKKRISLAVPTFRESFYKAQASKRVRRTTVHDGPSLSRSKEQQQELSKPKAGSKVAERFVPKRAFQLDCFGNSPAGTDSPNMFSEEIFDAHSESMENVATSPELPGYIRSPTSMRRALHLCQIEVPKLSALPSPVVRRKSLSAVYDPVSLVYLGTATPADHGPRATSVSQSIL